MINQFFRRFTVNFSCLNIFLYMEKYFIIIKEKRNDDDDIDRLQETSFCQLHDLEGEEEKIVAHFWFPPPSICI